MSRIPARLRRFVQARAGERCEYCLLAQDGQEAVFHIDHVIPVTNDGPTTAANLALACVSCSLRKAARRSAKDPETGRVVTLYHPRRQNWKDHFHWQGVTIVGLTAIGRATVAALEMNRALMLAIREEEAARGRLRTF